MNAVPSQEATDLERIFAADVAARKLATHLISMER